MRAGPQQNAVGCAAAGSFVGVRYAMNTPAVDMDDLAIATYQQGGEFLRQGRITVWLLQALTGIMTYQHFWPELFFALSLVLAGILLAAVLYTAARRQAKQPGAQLLAAGLLLWPYHGEILMYSNQCGVGFGYLLCALALALALPHLLCGWRNSLPGACGAVVCPCFALGCTKLCPSLADAAVRRPAAGCRGRGTSQPKSRKDMGQHSARTVAAGRGTGAAQRAGRPAVRRKRRERADGTASKTIFWFQRDSVRAAVVILCGNG